MTEIISLNVTNWNNGEIILPRHHHILGLATICHKVSKQFSHISVLAIVQGEHTFRKNFFELSVTLSTITIVIV